MNPYPLSALNHLTVPVAIEKTPPPLLRNGQRRRGVAHPVLAQVVPTGYQASLGSVAAAPIGRVVDLAPAARARGRRGEQPQTLAAVWAAPAAGVPLSESVQHASGPR